MENNIKQLDLHSPDEPYGIRHRKYLAEVRKIQKSHLSKDEWNTKEKINEDWEKTWLPFIQYDHQWDYAYLLDIIIYKLELMRTSFKYFCSHVDQEKMIRQIDEAIILGKRIYDDKAADGNSYTEPWRAYHKKYSTSYAYVYEKPDGNKNCIPGQEKLLAKIKMPDDDSMNFKSTLNKKYKSPLDKWLKETNKTDYQDVTVAYGSEWNNFPILRHLISRHILNKCNKKYKKDKEKFFKIISDNLESWWD